ncbi:MAG TPA: glycosyltransferase family 4 protein, partial [Patescibacteria group bacterium]|nr:glycosyltransferase family 4 protein [Patescibacteria group bacterium]
MKILFISNRYAPAVGGVETVTCLLGEALAEAGHEITIVTRERGKRRGRAEVLRRPGLLRLFHRYVMADAIVVQGATLRLGWPLLWLRRCALMVHHMLPALADGQGASWRGKLCGRVRHATVSRAMAKQLPWPVHAILPNPYDAKTFRINEKVVRARDVVFVGRLIPEKGAHVLLEALGMLQEGGLKLTASVVGEGPEYNGLLQLAAVRRLNERVRFLGQVTGEALAEQLNR